MQLSNEFFHFYHGNGYLIIPALFSGSECERILAICKAHADKDFRALINLNEKEEEVRKFISDQRIVSIVETLHNARMGYLGCQILFKEAGTPFANHGWNPHQDNAYINAPYCTYISAIIPLQDSDPENGGQYIYPKSHLEPLLQYEPYPSYDPEQNPGHYIRVPPLWEKKRMDLRMTQGSFYIQHGNIIHGSYRNTSKRSRPHIGIQCIVEGVSFDSGSKKQRKFTSFH